MGFTYTPNSFLLEKIQMHSVAYFPTKDDTFAVDKFLLSNFETVSNTIYDNILQFITPQY